MTTRQAFRLILTAGALAFGQLLALPALAQEAPEPPSRAAPAREPDLPSPAAKVNLALTGVAITGAWYAGALGASFAWQNGPWAPSMRIPVVGPWLAMPHFGCGDGELNCGTALVVVRGILAGMDGIGQAGGLFIALESLFLPTRAPQRARAPRSTKHAWVRPVPFVAGRDGVGLGIVGEM
jgi:hypothetical protein